MALLQALLINSKREEAVRLLAEIYRQIDPDGSAIIHTPSRVALQLNADASIVKRHLCQAYMGLVAVFTEAGQTTLAEKTRQTARETYKCDIAAKP